MSQLVPLLERLGVDPSLAGDLIEEYASGRSRMWLVWQAFVATMLAIVRGLRRHKVLAIRAILVGFLAVNVVSRVTTPLLHAVEGALESHGYAGARLWFGFNPYVLVPTFVMIRSMAVGWITGRLHRPYSVPLVAGLSVVLALTKTPAIYRLLVDTFTNTRFISYLCVQVGDVGLMVVGLLFGAAMSGSLYEGSGVSPSA